MSSNRRICAIAIVVLFAVLALIVPSSALAGIYDAEEETTYKEYWVPHIDWPYFELDDLLCSPKNGSPESDDWFIEPTRYCDASTTFELPDDVSTALRAEIYLDLWRAYVEQASNFYLNESELYHADVGSDWSRTPYIGPVELADINQGTNTFVLPAARPHHVHDIAIRVYYDGNNPITPGSGSDVTAPTGRLLTVKGDGTAINAATGGTLTVNGNKITLKAEVNADAAFVEFHGYYFGYDEDNDGKFLDWHSRGRNNCHPGGARSPSFTNPTSYRCSAGNPDGGQFGTIDHIGTVKTNGAGQYSVDWDVATVPDQENVRFKIRVVDADGNVRDAAGGVSAEFNLVRSRPVVAFYDRDFRDTGLNIAPRENVTQEFRSFVFPPGINDFENARVVQSYWRGARLEINGNNSIWPSFLNGDSWQRSIDAVNSNWLQEGTNQLRYHGTSWAFVEKPGPMFLLQRKASVGADTSPPTIYNHLPARDEVDVDTNTNIEFQLFDSGSGIDKSTIQLQVNGAAVTPSIIGSKHSYIVQYNPPSDFVQGEEVAIAVDACDLDGRCMTQDSYSFAIYAPPVESDVASDDFNRCSDPLNGDLWTFRNPRGDITYQLDGENFVMTVPAGATHDLWSNNKDAGRLIQPVVDGDFDIEVKFLTLPDPLQRNQIQGIVVEEDENNFLRFDVSSNGSELKIGAYLIEENSATSRGGTQVVDSDSGYEAFFMRLSRVADGWQASYSFDQDDWTSFANFTQVLDVTGVGVHAGNAGDKPEFTSIVDYFFNRVAPIAPEDGTTNNLADPAVFGNGSVEVTPDCGAPVTLTAIPASTDWRFVGWSGSLTGETNPATLNSLNGGEAITATFKLARQLSVTVDGPGAVNKSPDQAEYLDGDTVDLAATPDPDAVFLGWSGDLNGTATVESLLMNGDKSVTATFATVYRLDLSIIGGGTVTASPTNSEGLPEGDYFAGTEVVLTPAADMPLRFIGWDGDLTGTSAPATLVMDSDKSVSADFVEVRRLTVNQAGAGQGTIEFAPESSDGYYAVGSVVTLNAVAADTALFDGWSGDVTSSSSTIQVLMDQDRTITGTFLALYSVATGVDGDGSMTINPVKAQYLEGEEVTLQAFPAANWVFVGWSGLPGSENPVTVPVNRDMDVKAVFAENPTTLSRSVIGQGAIQADPDRSTFSSKETVTLTAVPADGWLFVGWSGDIPADVDADGATIVLSMTTDRGVTARFELDSHDVYLPMITNR